MNKKALGLVGLGAVAAVGGTLAYFNNTATLDNPLTTGHYSNQLVEEFTPPPTDLEPGAEWEKKVGATNTGDYPVLVRIRMEEEWTRKNPTNDPAVKAYITHNSNDKEDFLGIDGSYADGAFTADQADHNVMVDGKPVGGDTDGLWENDGTTVYKDLNLAGNAKDKGWFYDGGYWYWTRVLEPASDDPTTPNPKSKTSDLMNSLVLASNLDTGRYKTTEYYKTSPISVTDPELDKNNKWVEVVKNAVGDYMNPTNPSEKVPDSNKDGKYDIIDLAAAINFNDATHKLFRKAEVALIDGSEGYADSNYTLTITADFVEATSDAVEAAWGIDNISAKLPAIVGNDNDTTLENDPKVPDTGNTTP